ncbi:MAG: hypothetical protein IKH65_11575 [Clostridia bacterium]|nr:hypothetical protein [Clostridia bacterium]
MQILPDLMTLENGRPVTDAGAWKERRAELLGLFSEKMFGFMPKAPEKVIGETVEKSKTAAGHALTELINIRFDTPKGEFAFPLKFTYPAGAESVPTFVFINFRPELYDSYCPLEEIIDSGFAVASVFYKDITSDDGNFDSKLASHFPRESGTDTGKIGLWAYACSRVADYLQTRNEADSSNLAVIGHSRLGKTALWCSANDSRFRFAISNCSGCCGAAYEREKHGNAETYKKIQEVFPYWFCKNFENIARGNEEAPFDQHMLLALTAPRYLLVGSASLDEWADPYSEQMACMGASPAWKVFGLNGFIGKETPAAVGEDFSKGEIHYHNRDGEHFLSRNNWNQYMKFIKSKTDSRV